jgi:hypothetical protein
MHLTLLSFREETGRRKNDRGISLMLEQMKKLTVPGQYVLLKIDHVDKTTRDKIVAFQDAIESIEPGTNVELDIKITLKSGKRKYYRI